MRFSFSLVCVCVLCYVFLLLRVHALRVPDSVSADRAALRQVAPITAIHLLVLPPHKRTLLPFRLLNALAGIRTLATLDRLSTAKLTNRTVH